MMRPSKFFNFLLLAYLVLLLGLGPSLHHYEALGFHQQSDSETAEEAPAVICSCHAHAPVKRENGDAQVVASRDGSHEDCAICRFFDDFQVVVYSFQLTINETPALSNVGEVPRHSFAYSVHTVARGPPTV